jgi:hypothetical protein
MLDPGAGYRPNAVPTTVCTPVDNAFVPPKIVTLRIVLAARVGRGNSAVS